MESASASPAVPEQDRVRIFDTTLRDGEQSPGVSLNPQEKLEIAQQLARLGVDVIEAGFPIASPGDSEGVQGIAREVEGPVICGLARTHKADIDAAWNAVKDADRPRIHTFISTSDIHIEHQLQTTREDVKGQAKAAVAMARAYTDDVEFSPMDATRSEIEFTAEVVAIAVQEGATTINIPDTVGYTTPQEYTRFLGRLYELVPGLKDVVLSVHTHDDLGLAVSNAFAGLSAGARQVECAINGIGERAGNCSLEEIVMLLRTRRETYGYDTSVNTRELARTSRMVSRMTGYSVPPNKAVVGRNAFAHESGIHQDGMLKNAATYEIMNPEDVGISRSNLVLGKHSGRHAFRDRVQQLGFSLGDDELNAAFLEFKKIADRKKEMFDGDIEAIIMNAGTGGDGPWEMTDLHITAGTGAIAAAAVRLRHADGRTVDEAAVGDGPVEAGFKALERATGINLDLRNFEVRSVTVGEDAQGEVTVTVDYNGQSHRGHGVSTDIVEAGALAYLEVINRVSRQAAGKPATATSPADNGVRL